MYIYPYMNALLISGKGCQHVNKAVNFSSMKKGLAKQTFGECAVCISFLTLWIVIKENKHTEIILNNYEGVSIFEVREIWSHFKI